MNQGWVKRRLREVTTKIGSGATPLGGETAYKSEGISLIRSLNVHDEGFRAKDLAFIDDKQADALDNVVVESGDVLLNITGASVARCCVVPDDMLPARVNQHVSILRPKKDQLLPKLLHYLLISKDYKDRLLHAGEGGGSTRQALTKSQLQDFSIEYPDTLAEQRRIVGILGEAFDGIATAQANAEKNLQNAHALFESHLQAVFTLRGDGWVDTPLGSVCGFVRGPFGGSLKKSVFVPAGFAVYEQQHAIYNQFEEVRYFIDEAKFKAMKRFELLPHDLIMSCSGTMGRVAIVPNGIQRGIINQALLKLTPTARISNTFLKFWMESEAFQDALKEYSGGAAIQNVASVKILKEIRVPLPPVEQQTRVVDNLNAIRDETQRLESVYQRKLVALDELKKSLLHQAFSGKLTTSGPIAVRPDTLPFLTTIPNISATDLHAGILARAFQLHDEQGKREVFTHVKAEKIAHMIEARLGIDLGRKPVKDAAGPNDFPHLKKVEHRAKMANFFDFKQQRDGKYQVNRLRGFDQHIKRTFDALGDRATEVEGLLRWMLSMSVRQAELTATVFAAWNNLLLDGKQPTDEEIVLESRENWHPDKLNIDRARFFKVIEWLRSEGTVPQGRGKRVVEREG